MLPEVIHKCRVKMKRLKSALSGLLLPELDDICFQYVCDPFNEFERDLFNHVWGQPRITHDQRTQIYARLLQELQTSSNAWSLRFLGELGALKFRDDTTPIQDALAWSLDYGQIDRCHRIRCYAPNKCICGDPIHRPLLVV